MTPTRIAMMWSLKVQIACSAWLEWCMSGRTSLNSNVIASLYAVLISLSKTWRSTKRPWTANPFMMALYAVMQWWSLLVWKAYWRIRLPLVW